MKNEGSRDKRGPSMVDRSGCQGLIDPPVGYLFPAIDALGIDAKQHLDAVTCAFGDFSDADTTVEPDMVVII